MPDAPLRALKAPGEVRIAMLDPPASGEQGPFPVAGAPHRRAYRHPPETRDCLRRRGDLEARRDAPFPAIARRFERPLVPGKVEPLTFGPNRVSAPANARGILHICKTHIVKECLR